MRWLPRGNRLGQIAGLLVAGAPFVKPAIDWFSKAAGIHADAPDFYDSIKSIMNTIWNFVGFDGLAILAGTLMFVWATWGTRFRDATRSFQTTIPDAIGEQLASTDPQLIAGQERHTPAPHDPALEQLIRMYIVPASKRIRSISTNVDVASRQQQKGTDFFCQFFTKKNDKMLSLEYDLIYPASSSEPADTILRMIDEYDELEHGIHHVMLSIKSENKIQLEYDEWKQTDKEFKRQLTAFASKRGYENLYNMLGKVNWIVT